MMPWDVLCTALGVAALVVVFGVAHSLIGALAVLGTLLFLVGLTGLSNRL